MPLWGKIFASMWIVAGIFLAGSLFMLLMSWLAFAGGALIIALIAFVLVSVKTSLTIFASVFGFIWLINIAGAAFVLLFLLLIRQWYKAPPIEEQPRDQLSPPAE